MEMANISKVFNCDILELCRSCLTKSDNFVNLSPWDDSPSDFVAMLASVGNFEIDINERLPSNLCRNCADKLISSYEFQSQLQHSNEVLKQYLNGDLEAITDLNDTENNGTSSEIRLDAQLEDVDVKSKLIFPNDYVQKAIETLKVQPEMELMCIECNYTASSLKALSSHMTHLHRELKDSWCAKCNILVENLDQHKNNHQIEDLKCQLCHKLFKVRAHLVEHLLSHSEKRLFKCDSCDSSYATKRHYNRHLQSHLDWKEEDENGTDDEKGNKKILNYCEVCERRVRSLKQHIDAGHDHDRRESIENKKGPLCTVCGKTFSSKSKFSVHMRIHTGETPYNCRFCDMAMRSRSHLKAHERTHTGEKPYVCKICSKTFTQSGTLKTHMMLHTGKSEKCQLCEKSFCRPAQLKNHMRKHTGEKPHVCHQCGRGFRQSSHLVQHLTTHSAAKPFSCQHCTKTFKYAMSLKEHLQTHSVNGKKKSFQCSWCPYTSQRKVHLDKHVTQHSQQSGHIL